MDILVNMIDLVRVINYFNSHFKQLDQIIKKNNNYIYSLSYIKKDYTSVLHGGI